MKGKILLSAVAVIFIGCASHQTKVFNDYTGDNLKDMKKFSEVKEKFYKEEKKVKPIIDVSTPKTLSTALKELSLIDKKIYYLDKNSKDVTIPTLSEYQSRMFAIDSFQKLKNFIEKTTNYSIYIVNPYTKGIKIVKVYDKNSKKTDFSKISFEIDSEMAFDAILKEISKRTDFSIVFSKNLERESLNLVHVGINIQNGKNGSFLNGKFYFKGKNLKELLDYISEYYDLYIDIDYDKKIIKFSKYKTKMFELLMPDINVNLNDDSTPLTAGGTKVSSNSKSSVKSTLSFGLIKDFVKNIKDIVKTDKKSNVYVNSNGLVIVKTTKNKMKLVEKLFDKYNGYFSQQLSVKLDVYEFFISKNFNYGTDILEWNINQGKMKMKTSFNGNNYIFDFVSSNHDFEGGANVNNSIIKFAKKYSFDLVTVNNVPQSIQLLNNKDYIKSVTTTTTTGTSTTTQTQTDIGSIGEGQTITILPKLFGNKVFIKTQTKLLAINNLTTQKVGDTTITLPDVTQKVLPNVNVLKLGEKKVIGVYEIYENGKQYKGILPVEFFVAGNNGDKYVRKLIVFVAQVKKIN